MLTVLFKSRCKTSSITKIIVCRNLITSRKRNSFQERIINYFENVLKTKTPSQLDEKLSIHKDIASALNDTIVENLIRSGIVTKKKAIYEEFEKLSEVQDTQIILRTLCDLDDQCYQILESLTNSEILTLLNAFSKVSPSVLAQSYFYNKAIPVLIKAAECKHLNNNELVQLLFYISLRKETAGGYIEYLKPYLPKMEDLPLLEKCIAAQSFEKASATLSYSEQKQFEKIIENEFEELIADPNLLMSLSKSLISNDQSIELTLKTLSQSVLELQVPLDFRTNVHILSLYAVALLFEPKPIDHLVKNCIGNVHKDMINKEYKLDLRDFTSLLWCLSYLGLTLTLDEKMILRTYMEDRIKEYKLRENVNILVETILYLHMLRSWSTRILKTCFQERTFNTIFPGHSWKAKTKLQLLVSQISMEMKMTVPKSLQKRISISYTPSENLRVVEGIAMQFVEQGILESARVECPISTLIIPGITMKTEHSTFHVDILDDSTCLRNTHIPHGLMNLKLRLLSRLRYRQILLNGRLFNNLSQRSEIVKQLSRHIAHGRAATFFEKENI